jgi:hypothetical protein
LRRRIWILAPILASLATQCDESPRGTAPSLIASIELRLDSVPADAPTDEDEARMYGFCLQRMSYANHVRPSWRAREEITLEETAPNVFVAPFNDVPVNFSNSIIVHDENECRRAPVGGSGRVVTGVTINDQPVTRQVGSGVLGFTISADGIVR